MNIDFSFWVVGGGNESGYGQQYGVRVALLGQRLGVTRNGALTAVSDELSPRRPDRAAPVRPAWFADLQIRRIYGSDRLRSTTVESARAATLLRRRIAPSEPTMARASTTTAVVRCLFDDDDLEMDTVSRNDTHIAP